MSLSLALALLLLSQADSPKPGALDFRELPPYRPSEAHLKQVLDAMKMPPISPERFEALRGHFMDRTMVFFGAAARRCVDPDYQRHFKARFKEATGREPDAADMLEVVGTQFFGADRLYWNHYVANERKTPSHVARGCVLDDKGKAVPEAEVSFGGRTAFTDADGKFAIPFDFHKDRDSLYLIQVDAGARGGAFHQIDVPALKKGDPLDLPLNAKHRFFGVVRDDKGEPFQYAALSVQMFRANRGVSALAVTDGDGRYRVVVPEGASVNSVMLEAKECKQSVIRKELQPFPLDEPNDFVIQRIPHGTVEGIVVDRDGNPIPFCSVTGGSADAKGRFVARVPAGKKSKLRAFPDDFAPTTLEVDVEPEKKTDPVEIRCAPRSTPRASSRKRTERRFQTRRFASSSMARRAFITAQP